MSKSVKNLFSLKNKVIVITGAGGFLGKKHAEIIAAYGGNPVLIDISKDEISSLAKAINKKYAVSAIAYKIDITDELQIKNNVLQILKKFGKIDCLVNNAANNPKVENNQEKFSRLENFELETWNNDVAVGLTGAFLCAKHYGFAISKNSKGGSIINISSDLGLIAPDQRLYMKSGISENEQSVKPVSYSVIKSGLIGLTRYLSTYWPDKNVRCNALCPGGVENGQDTVFVQKVSSRIPLGRMAKADEYQGTLVWMLSDSSSYLNGAIITIDGGRTAI